MVTAFRILGSFLAAIVVVLLLLITGLEIYGQFHEPDAAGLQAHPVELLDEFRRADLAAELGENRPPPDPVAVPRLELPGPTTSNASRSFVELEVWVGVDGSVDRIKVLNAFPEGVYERQAIEEVRQRRFEPAVPGPASERRIEVVEFSTAGDAG